ncbi:MAG: hypothetical protein EXS58_00145 [Candidatus Latescibacteria bacterium]|nr:hypothetical protein [Candidatus Latescibacterota bacterium]
MVKPLGFIRPESGLEIPLVNFSTGGLLIESSPEFLSFVLQEKCPVIDENTDYSSEPWPEIFEEMRRISST